ncbi:hypothetical protein FHS81_002692 [Pseudochelatococcus contaminans]|uniref:Uncharacterized protein n=1 Tax=Pseudochelatococcus contaminans TaxID=1538103 RepID=A0A7W6EI00_9HYPH|nr:hypothetical protein [Pseudochelatococcus contaminans]
MFASTLANNFWNRASRIALNCAGAAIEAPVLQHGSHKDLRKTGNAESARSRLRHQFTVVQSQGAGHVDCHFLAMAGEFPAIAFPTRQALVDAAMSVKIL